jgi:penicillin-binding protein 1A
VYDTPELIRDRWTGQPWQPRNFEREEFAGPMTIRKALAESKNTVAVKLISDIGRTPGIAMNDDDAQDVGLAKVKDTARRAGIDSPIPDSITAALGSGEVSPLELVNGYATLAMQGRYAKPVLVRRVKNPAGDVLLENKPEYIQQPPVIPGMPPSPPAERGLRADVAFVTSEIMRSVVEDPDGTGRGLARLGRPIAGKTGTASEHRDGWFVGFTPEVVSGVWVGFDDHQMLGARETGGHCAGPIWLDFMKVAETTRPTGEFEVPPGVAVVQIDPRTGMLADEHSPFVEREVYLAGTEPKEVGAPPTEAKPEDFMRGDGP